VRIDVWSDIACPWCWLGKHHLEEALRLTGIDAMVELRSFELDPTAGPTRPARERLVAKFGDPARLDAAHARLTAMGERVGIRYDFAAQRLANTFDAHRVHHLAKERGRGAEVVERFMRAYHGEGADLADHATIRRLAVEAGLDGEDVDRVLAGDAYAAAVREDELTARELGIHGVPFFLVDGQYGVSGAQPVELFARALKEVTTRREPSSASLR
jgi:predicted DsbA family dithiol-disulfide isomerase